MPSSISFLSPLLHDLSADLPGLALSLLLLGLGEAPPEAPPDGSVSAREGVAAATAAASVHAGLPVRGRPEATTVAGGRSAEEEIRPAGQQVALVHVVDAVVGGHGGGGRDGDDEDGQEGGVGSPEIHFFETFRER